MIVICFFGMLRAMSIAEDKQTILRGQIDDWILFVSECFEPFRSPKTNNSILRGQIDDLILFCRNASSHFARRKQKNRFYDVKSKI